MTLMRTKEREIRRMLEELGRSETEVRNLSKMALRTIDEFLREDDDRRRLIQIENVRSLRDMANNSSARAQSLAVDIFFMTSSREYMNYEDEMRRIFSCYGYQWRDRAIKSARFAKSRARQVSERVEGLYSWNRNKKIGDLPEAEGQDNE